MIHMTTDYNQDQYISYFRARKACYKLVYTHASKSDVFWLFEKAINYIETQFHCKIWYIHLDRETSLEHNFEDFITQKDLKPECSAPYTPVQNRGAESSGRVLITKARLLRIEAKLLADLWLKCMQASHWIVLEQRTEWLIIISIPASSTCAITSDPAWARILYISDTV